MYIIIMFLLFNLSWGTNPTIIKWALGNSPPENGALLCYLLSFLFFAPVFKSSFKFFLKASAKEQLLIFANGIIAFGIGPSFSYRGLTLAHSGEASIFVAVEPLFATVLAILFLKEKLRIHHIISIFIAIIGIYFIQNKSNEGSPIGNLFYLVNVLANAFFSVISAKLLKLKWNHWQIMTMALFFGNLVLLPQVKLYSYDASEIQNLFLGIGLFCGIWCTSIGFLFWAWSLKSISVIMASLTLYLQPISGNLMAIIVLDEFLHLKSMFGGVLILLALFVNFWERTKKWKT